MCWITPTSATSSGGSSIAAGIRKTMVVWYDWLRGVRTTNSCATAAITASTTKVVQPRECVPSRDNSGNVAAPVTSAMSTKYAAALGASLGEPEGAPWTSGAIELGTALTWPPRRAASSCDPRWSSLAFGLPSFTRRAKPQEQKKPWNVASARLPHRHYCKLGRLQRPNIPFLGTAANIPQTSEGRDCSRPSGSIRPSPLAAERSSSSGCSRGPGGSGRLRCSGIRHNVGGQDARVGRLIRIGHDLGRLLRCQLVPSRVAGSVALGGVLVGGICPGDVGPGDVRECDVGPGDRRPGDVGPGDHVPRRVRPGDRVPGD